MSALTTLSNNQLTVSVADAGAEMHSFQAGGTDLLWNADPAWWGSRAPLLFPIIGNAPHGKLTVGGIETEITRHGFARGSVFEKIEASDTHVVHRLTDSDITRAQYPFAFAMTVTYRLVKGTLTNTVEIENRSMQPMPVGVGFHPAFLCPLANESTLPQYIKLANGAEPALARLTDDNQYVQNTRAPSPFTKGYFAMDRTYFDADAMIFPEGAGDALTLGAEGGSQLGFTFHNLPILAIWAKPGPCPFVCIEPWSSMAAPEGASNDIRERFGTEDLAPGASKTFGYSVTPKLA